MFDNLSEKLQDVFRKLRGEGKLSEENIADALREVRRALLEADVSLPVVKTFIAKVREKSLGQEVLKSLSPGQQFIKIVHDELVELMGGSTAQLHTAPSPPTVILMAGLQGSGKTTTSAKLALHLRRQGRRPMLVAADIYRPAAIKQLQVLGKQIDIPVFSLGETNPVEIVQGALVEAKANGHDYVILDTAGRLHIDEALMDELRQIVAVAKPQEVLLVVDAMIGQDAVKMAAAFHEALAITGVVITKLDGDTRGGAALSVKSVTGCPIKFMTTGEKLDALEPFHPERIATRILGMGDVLTLIEKAQASIDADEARKLEKKLRKAEFTFDDFLSQMKTVKKLGSLKQILGMLPLPGLSGKINDEQIEEGERQMKRIEAIIFSMTPQERRDPAVINNSRKHRIANGSGTNISEVNALLKQFQQMRKMFKSLADSGMMGGGQAAAHKTMARLMKQGKLPMGAGEMPPNLEELMKQKPPGGFPFRW